MKKIYSILTSTKINDSWGAPSVDFTISYEKKANLQMDTIYNLVKEGK